MEIELMLEKKDQLLYKVLKYVSAIENQVVSYEELFIVTELSQQTLSKLIYELKELVNQDQTMEIETSGASHYKFIKKNGFSLGYYFGVLLKKSYCFNILVDLFYGKKITLEKVSQNFFFSQSTVSRKLKLLRCILRTYDLDIKRRNKTYVLTGKEERIRYFFYLLFDISQYEISPFVSQTVFSYDHFCDIFPKMSQQFIDRFSKFFSVCRSRFFQGNQLSDSIEEISMGFEQYSYERFKANMFKITQAPLAKNVIENEFRFLYFFFYTGGIIDMETIKEVSIDCSANFYNSDEFFQVNTIIDTFTDYMAIGFTDDDLLFLKTNLFLAIKKYKMFTSITKIEYEDINLEKNSFFSAIYQDFFSFYHSKMKQPIPLSQEIFHLIVGEFILKNESGVVVHVYSKYGSRQKELIEKKISNCTDVPIEFVNRLDNNRLHLIVSDGYFRSNSNVAYFYIQDYIEGDIGKLVRVINDLYFELKSKRTDTILNENRQINS